jgi:hypothetical protein
MSVEVGATVYWYYFGRIDQSVVLSVTAKQFKTQDRYGKSTRRLFSDIGQSWFLSERDALIAEYERLKLNVAHTQRVADRARDEKQKFREKHASILHGIEG